MANIKLSPIANQDEVFNSPRSASMNRRILKKQVRVDGALVNLESAIVQTEASISTSISQYDTGTVQPAIAGREPVIYKSTTAPEHAEGRLWMDTNTTPNLIYRSTSGAWVRASFSQSDVESTASSIASSVVSTYSYSKGEVDTTLTGYSQISQTSSAITLAVGTIAESTGNYVPYTQDDFEQGTLSLVNGTTSGGTTTLRTKTFASIPASTEMLLVCSDGGIDAANTFILYYTSADAFISYHQFTDGYRKVTTPATAAKFKIRFQKNPLTTITLAEMPNFKVSVTQVAKYLKGARYEFNDTNFTITNNVGTTVFTADVDGNLDITGKITAGSGSIAGFTINTDQLIAGSSTSRVGVAPGKESSGYYYAFWAGGETPSSAPFRVLNTGGLRSTSAIIGGWTVNSSQIYKGDIILDSTNERIYAGTGYIYNVGSGTVGVSGNLYVSSALTVNGTLWGSGEYIGSSTTRWAGIYVNLLNVQFSGTNYTITRDSNGFLKAV